MRVTSAATTLALGEGSHGPFGWRLAQGSYFRLICVMGLPAIMCWPASTRRCELKETSHDHRPRRVRPDLQQTNLWLKDLMERLGTGDRKLAYNVLKATLHALRDRIGPENAIHLGAQLPILVRGIYYDG